MKTYVLDTNIFRYKTSKDNSEEAKKLRGLAHQFFSQVQPKIDNNEIVLVVPQEVKNELEVQFFGLKAKQVSKINEILNKTSNILTESTSREMEHQVRIIASYVKQAFQQDLDKHNLKMEYPGVSDVRIMMATYTVQSAVSIVTANTRDFLILLFLDEYNSKEIYSLKEQSGITLPLELYDKVHNDETFSSYLNEFFKILERM